MYKKFLLSLVFVGNIGAQSDAMQVNLAELDPVDLANDVYSVEALCRSKDILKDMTDWPIADSGKTIEFMKAVDEKFRYLEVEQRYAFIIYLSYFANSEYGELGCTNQVVDVAVDILDNLIKNNFFEKLWK